MSKAVHDLFKAPRPGTISVAGDFPLDESFLANFPDGTKVISASRYGTSAWTITARITVEFIDGAQARYFLKCAAEDGGRIMMEGEYNAMSELYRTMPNFVPKPISWGKYGSGNPDTYFFLSDFVDMSNRMPDPNQLCGKLAQLHRSSLSPTGKFGMSVTTCQGRTPQAVEWDSSWTRFFEKLLRHVTELDFETNGYWEGLDLLEKRVFDSVIPRLIGALEQDGRMIKPSLIHADLWEGNTGISYQTGDVYIFDSGAFYAHNEMEIGDWRCNYNKIHNKVYTRTYLRHNGPSEPKEEWDDRNPSNRLNRSLGICTVTDEYRVYDDCYYLIDKYAPFANGRGPPRLSESDKVSLSTERDHTKA